MRLYTLGVLLIICMGALFNSDKLMKVFFSLTHQNIGYFRIEQSHGMLCFDGKYSVIVFIAFEHFFF